MVTRRRPKQYRDGGAVVPDPPAVVDAAPAAVLANAPPPAAAPDILPASPEASDAVMAALVAQKRAEAMQRGGQAAAPAPQSQPAAPQMSERRQRFVEAHPELLDPRNREAVESYWKQAQRMGMQDEAEVDNFVLSGLRWEQATRSPRREEPEPAPSRAESPLPRSMPEQRRSMPMTAPVSREVPNTSGRRRSSGDPLHLTEEERQAARDAIPDRPDLPRLTNAQKEYLYAQNKQKYGRMKADGTYSEQRQR
jgi:hypothetical protein